MATKVSRRRFISGTVGLALARKLTYLKRPALAPVLYGDGRHDDTVALNAWGAGRPVVWPDGSAVGPTIASCIFWVTGQITISRQDPVALLHNYFHVPADAVVFA
jgi:hypothetical protein